MAGILGDSIDLSNMASEAARLRGRIKSRVFKIQSTIWGLKDTQRDGIFSLLASMDRLVEQLELLALSAVVRVTANRGHRSPSYITPQPT